MNIVRVGRPLPRTSSRPSCPASGCLSRSEVTASRLVPLVFLARLDLRVPGMTAKAPRWHGHRAWRVIKAALASAWIEFGGAAQVAQLRRTLTR